MRVLCIKDSPEIGYTRKGSFIVPENLRVHCGEIYTIKTEVFGYRGEKKWVLYEKPDNCRYKKEYFSPLSDIESFEEEEVKECVLVEIF